MSGVYENDSLHDVAPDLADARDAWWQTWEEAQPDKRLPFEIGEGWDAAWDCIEQAIAAHDAEVAASALEAWADDRREVLKSMDRAHSWYAAGSAYWIGGDDAAYALLGTAVARAAAIRAAIRLRSTIEVEPHE